MDIKRHEVIRKSNRFRPKKSIRTEDKDQKYVFLNDDLHSYIATINKNFDFKTFNNKTLKEVEIVSIQLIKFILFYSPFKI
jgi:hypothetical protein